MSCNMQNGEGSTSTIAPRDGETGTLATSRLLSVSPTRFSTLSTDFRLPSRGKNSGSSSGQAPLSPHSIGGSSSRNDETQAGPSNSSRTATPSFNPLLRRSAVAAAAFANTNRSRLRRGSMLGYEVARSTDILSSSEEDEDMDSDDEHRHHRQHSGDADCNKTPSRQHHFGRRDSSGTPPQPHSGSNGLRGDLHGNDIDMQLEAGDVSLESVRLESKSRASTPSRRSASPSEMRTGSARAGSSGKRLDETSPSLSSMTTASSRRALAKRQTAPRDRDMQRVAASLKDETRPSENEIASEAKLQRHLIPSYESTGLATPRLLAVGAHSPNARSRSSSAAGYFGQGVPLAPGADRAYEDDDLAFHDHFYMGDEDDTSDEEEGIGPGIVKTSIATPAGTAAPRFDDSVVEDEQPATGSAKSIAIPDATPREFLWLGFRETTPGPRGSPGTDRILSRSARAVTAGTVASDSPGPPHDEDKTGMDVEESGPPSSLVTKASNAPVIQSGTAWGRTMKRKLGDERFEPYALSLHKRRAVSPSASSKLASPTLGSVEHGSSAMFPPRSRASTPTTALSPHLLSNYLNTQTSPLTSHFTGPLTPGVLPNPTPLSIPSPTLAASQRHQYFGHGSRASSAALPSSALSTGAGANADDSHTSRPSTPSGVMAQRSMPSSSTPGTNAGGSPFYLSTPASSLGPKAAGIAGSSGLGLSSTTKGAGTTPSTTTAAAGSGPGYGSGALGLSIGSGSRRFKEEQAAQEEEEGMLGDVSAIHLGEM